MRGQAELNRVGSPAGLLDGLALAIALFQKTQVVLDIFVGGILALGSHKRRVRAFVVAAQHIRIALVVQNLGRRSKDADRLTIGAISKIKTPQAIIGRGKAEPGLRVARMRLDGAAEMFLGDAVIVRAIILLAENSVRRMGRCRASRARLVARPTAAAPCRWWSHRWASPARMLRRSPVRRRPHPMVVWNRTDWKSWWKNRWMCCTPPARGRRR